MKTAKKKNSHPLAKAIAVAALAGGSFFLIKYGDGRPIPVPVYQTMRVIDGDTFETTEKQLIRVASVQAPEMGLCGSQEAKDALEKLVLGHPLYLKVLYRDPYNRLISQVYNEKEYVNVALVEQGFAYYYNREKALAPELKIASDKARKNKRGIFGLSCTQTKNADHPTCTIKGNVREKKTYFIDGCNRYSQTEIQLYLGDQWFCTEAEAQKAGFVKGVQCP